MKLQWLISLTVPQIMIICSAVAEPLPNANLTPHGHVDLTFPHGLDPLLPIGLERSRL
jgi:hypothetical protein